ncbi:MAG: hypothetical protein M3Y43_01770 [Pseudomonadota bacterium]|nr:hypothetical protein [Pseudomonadota bacterium]MDQ2703873.1 hypothetical protein [Pseudomonadota bacterium]
MRTKTTTASSALSELLPEGQEAVIERLRRSLSAVALDCGCRDVADDLLDRARAEEDLMRRADGLADARKMRDAIVVVLALLGEMDELTPDEPDRSVFREMADLFQDVTEFATHGAKAARQAAGD